MDTPSMTTTLGYNVRAARGRLDLSVRELAIKARVGRKTVGAIERGEVITPQAPTLARLAAALGTTAEFLEGRVPAVPPNSERMSSGPALIHAETADPPAEQQGEDRQSTDPASSIGPTAGPAEPRSDASPAEARRRQAS